MKPWCQICKNNPETDGCETDCRIEKFQRSQETLQHLTSRAFTPIYKKQDEPKDKRTVWVRADDVALIKLYEEMADKGLYKRKGPSSEVGDNLIYEWNGD